MTLKNHVICPRLLWFVECILTSHYFRQVKQLAIANEINLYTAAVSNCNIAVDNAILFFCGWEWDLTPTPVLRQQQLRVTSQNLSNRALPASAPRPVLYTALGATLRESTLASLQGLQRLAQSSREPKKFLEPQDHRIFKHIHCLLRSIFGFFFTLICVAH